MVCSLMTIPSALSHPVTAHGCIDPSGKTALALQEYLSGGKVECGIRTREEGADSVCQPLGLEGIVASVNV